MNTNLKIKNIIRVFRVDSRLIFPASCFDMRRKTLILSSDPLHIVVTKVEPACLKAASPLPTQQQLSSDFDWHESCCCIQYPWTLIERRKSCMKKAILSLTSFILLAFTISLPLRADSVRTTVAIGSSSVGVA